MTSRPKLLILGHMRWGKDTVAEIMRDDYGYNFTSSSKFIGERFIFDRIGDFYRKEFAYLGHSMITDDMVFEAMYEDRSNHRALWFDLCAAYCLKEPNRTAKEMLNAGYDMYVGLRSRREYNAAKFLFDEIVWVDRSMHLPKEPRDSMELDNWDSTVAIDNNGTLEELKVEVDRLMRQLGVDRLPSTPN